MSGRAATRGSGRLTGKAAIITGGDSGIGRAVALAYAHEGADVLIAYLNEEPDAQETVRIIERAGRKAVAIPAISAMSSMRSRLWSGRCRSSASSTFWSIMRHSR
jgi:NAD(P)-dependent dehydrogenase (short-subunit alcohol dehydrogenase family)